MKDKVVLIAGGSGGIGSACAELFAQAGAKVVLAARDRNKADAIAEKINKDGGEAFAVDLDVTDLSSVFTMVDTITNELGQIDVLINAFGVGMVQPLLDVNPKELKKVIDTNVLGTILITQTVLRYMVTRKQGTVIMFPGILGKAVMKNSSVYSATKYAIQGFTKALIEEHRKSRVKFSLLYLGAVNTTFWDNANIDMRVQKEKMLDPREVAKTVWYAASQPEGSVLNEIVIQPDSQQLV